MQLVQFLGQRLKSDALMEIIDLHDLDILYHIDTLHENVPDSYSVRSKALGFELLFDEDQLLTTIFHSIASERALDAQAVEIGVPLYATIKEAQLAASPLGASFEFSENVLIPELALDVSWAKITLESHSRHYEYSSDGLRQVTLAVRKAAIT